MKFLRFSVQLISYNSVSHVHIYKNEQSRTNKCVSVDVCMGRVGEGRGRVCMGDRDDRYQMAQPKACVYIHKIPDYYWISRKVWNGFYLKFRSKIHGKYRWESQNKMFWEQRKACWVGTAKGGASVRWGVMTPTAVTGSWPRLGRLVDKLTSCDDITVISYRKV